MVFQGILERFAAESPVSVMVRATLENVFAPEQIDALFERSATRQYTRELMFSTVVDLMGLVACRTHHSVNDAYQHHQAQVGVSVHALYDKLKGMELGVSEALVRYTAQQTEELIRQMQGTRPPLLPGYRVRILDGNHLSGTEHRLKVLRKTAAGALPGQSLVLLDAETMLVSDVFLCADGHAQERSYLPEVLPAIAAGDLVIADCNMCTTGFLFGIARQDAFFLIRQHSRNLYWRLVGRRKFIGRSSTGRVYEQTVILTDPETQQELEVRRITVELNQPTRNGDWEIHLLTNVPAQDAGALQVAELYHGRWTLETAFQQVTVDLRCELNTLGYPGAALFAFCVALACYNLLAVVKGALRAVHGDAKVQQDVSNYYLTEEISEVYHGMLIAVPPPQWEPFQTLSVPHLAQVLLELARRVKLHVFQKHPRGPKKPPPKRRKAQFRHVSTAQLLEKAKEKARKKAQKLRKTTQKLH
jgi:hypothetical protein